MCRTDDHSVSIRMGRQGGSVTLLTILELQQAFMWFQVTTSPFSRLLKPGEFLNAGVQLLVARRVEPLWWNWLIYLFGTRETGVGLLRSMVMTYLESPCDP